MNKLALINLLAVFTNTVSQGANTLVNPGFEADNSLLSANDNIGVAVTAWLATGNRNLVMPDATYTDGPNSSELFEGTTYYDAANSNSILTQNFTITEESIVDFGGSFSGRRIGLSYSYDFSTINILDSSLAIVASVSSIADPGEFNWESISNTTTLGPGTYTFEISIGDFANVDAVFADVVPIPEPSSLALFGLGGFALVIRRKR